MEPTSKIHTSARANPVDPHSFTPPVTPRKKGFMPLKPYREPGLAPSRPRAGTLDSKAAKAFREAVADKLQRRATLERDSSSQKERGYSYLEGMSAQEAITGKMPEEEDPLSRTPTPPAEHLRPPPSAAVPSLNLFDVRNMPGAYAEKPDESQMTLDALNEKYGAHIPPVRRELDPTIEDQHGIFPFHLDGAQMETFPRSEGRESITFGRCTVPDSVLELLTERNPNLVEVVLFDCPNVISPSSLIACKELEELCLSWCSGLKFDWFPDVRWRKLQSLELANTAVTDVDLKALPPIASLRFIDLSHCKGVTDEGFLELFKHLNLGQIRIDGTNISDAAIEKFKLARPEIEIVKSAAYIHIEAPQESVQITHESAEYYPFLRKYMYEVHRIDNWTHLSELGEYAQGIERYFRQELSIRNMQHLGPLNTPEGWFLAERELQERDGPNLSRIMSRLIPQLRSQNFLKGGSTDLDCFSVFWEITVYPWMLNRICDLNLSKLGLTEIPHCFSFFFPRLRTLNLSGNPLNRLPEEYVVEYPQRKVVSFFSKFPELVQLDCSNCELRTMPEGFFSSLSSTDGETVSILPHLTLVDFGRNQIERLPDFFGLDKSRDARVLMVNLAKNDITYIHQKPMDDLADSAPVEITLDLRDNVLVPGLVALHIPRNVRLLQGLNVGRFVQGEEKKE